MKNKFASFYRRHRANVGRFCLGLLVLVLVGIGTWGWAKYPFNAHNKTGWALFWESFYHSLQLIVLDDGGYSGPGTIWQIEVARFLLPTIAVLSFIAVIFKVFREELNLVKARMRKDHVIVYGIGDKGLMFVKKYRECGYDVVAVEKDLNSPNINLARACGAIILSRNMNDLTMLENAGIERAKYLITALGSDSENVEIAVQAKSLCKKIRRDPLTCFIHVVDPYLCDLLTRQKVLWAQSGYFRFEFYNVFERSARLVLDRTDILALKKSHPEKPVRLLISGLGKMGRSIVLQAARKWSEVSSDSPHIEITCLDKIAIQKVEILETRFANLKKFCKLIPLEIPIESAEFEKGNFLFDSEGKSLFDAVYVSFDNSPLALTVALRLKEKLRGNKIPIYIRLTKEFGISGLLEADVPRGNEPDLIPFGLIDIACGAEILRGLIESLAIAIHEEYRRQASERGDSPEKNPSMVEWEKLPEHMKESNRHHAENISKKLESINCDIVSFMEFDAEKFAFSEDEIEFLARKEHERFVHERISNGWKPGEKKDIEKKISPYLVGWEELSEDVKEIDRIFIRKLPAILDSAGLRIKRLI